MLHDSDEGMSDWNTFYVLFHEPDRKTGWVYKIYLRRTNRTMQIGKRGSVRKRHGGEIEIDDVWSDSDAVNVINKGLLWFEFEPDVRVLSREVDRVAPQCYDGVNPAPK
jgi:hypothetical protein